MTKPVIIMLFHNNDFLIFLKVFIMGLKTIEITTFYLII